MVIIQIALGGITRLTGSGLSITEWEVVTGSFPPLNEAKWLIEFDKYKATPQYQLLNFDFTLSDFKSIFFWEWLHRFWARLLGLVFAVGFIYFLVTKKFKKDLIAPLIILFVLGGLQGFVGWIMVASGLTGDAVYVKPTRLALHFIFALGLLCYTFWFALKLKVPQHHRMGMPSLKGIHYTILMVLTLQLIYGALMAGHKAATAAPTWPTINASWFWPQGIIQPQHGWLNLIDNKIMVHFMHRGLAYLLLALTVFYYFRLRKLKGSALFQKTRWLPMGAILLQVFLGIITVLTSLNIEPGRWAAFEWSAQLHQLGGMIFLLVMVWMIYLTTRKAANEGEKLS